MVNIPIAFWQVCSRLDKDLIKEGLMLICDEEKIEYRIVDLRHAKKVDKDEIVRMARERGSIGSNETVMFG